MAFSVLLVEPDAGLADEIRRAFAPLGFSVVALQAGEPALERCREAPPDLILLAAELPDMSGFSVCNRLKRALSSVPLVLYTGEATDAAIEAHRATRTRADDYVKKPFDLADLLGRAAALLHADQPGPPPPPAPPAAPRPDGHRGEAAADPPPVLQRVDSGQVAARGLAALQAAAPRPAARRPGRGAAPAPGPSPASAPQAPAGPPAVPPPVPGARAAIGRVKTASPPGRDPFQVLDDWPRDPAPPKGTPEEKLEYFRDRLRARDAFLAKVRDAVAEMKGAHAQLAGERDLLQRDLEQERARALELGGKLAEAAQDAAAQAARIDDLRRGLEESETTRQSLSDVLSETIQQHEGAEQQATARIAAADAERARLEAELAERAESHARAVAALEADRADERARAEAERAEAADAHARALASEREDRERERADTAAKLVLAEERITALGVERDELQAELARREEEARARVALLEEEATSRAQAADEEAAALRARVDEAAGRGDALAGELAEARARIAALEEEAALGAEARAALEGELRAARAEARAYDEKAVAAEHAFHAKVAELAAGEQRIRDLAAALDEGRASAEGTRGELARIDALRAEVERRAAQLQSERDQLGREADQARRETAAAREETRAERERTAQLTGEVQRLAKLEPIAEEAARLRKEVASLRELLQQRTGAAESSARTAQAAAAEKARAEERLAVEGGRLQAQVARLEQEIAGARRRIEELEREGASREAALRKAGQDLEERRRSLAADAAEVERRHGAEVGRLKAAMVDLERHLEARARAELQLKRKVQELERAAQARPPPIASDPADVAKLKARVEKLAEEVEELRGENDFLNGEVARYVQKNKDLLAQLASLRET
jgi:CheY-like chemotaxis protein